MQLHQHIKHGLGGKNEIVAKRTIGFSVYYTHIVYTYTYVLYVIKHASPRNQNNIVVLVILCYRLSVYVYNNR
jgi:hypothetical protein